MTDMTLPKEGTLYKTYVVSGFIFEIRYGYYDESERERVEPLPLFPDLKAKPIYTSDGQPIVTSLQMPCDYYSPKDIKRREEWCGDCIYYSGGRNEIGVCLCELRRLLREDAI